MREPHRYVRELFVKLPLPAPTVSRFSSVARAAAGTATDTWIRHPLTFLLCRRHSASRSDQRFRHSVAPAPSPYRVTLMPTAPSVRHRDSAEAWDHLAVTGSRTTPG